MPIIPPNNTTGLYGVDTTVSINNNIFGNNMVLTGNAVVGGTISAAGNITTSGFFVGNFTGNITGNVTAAGSNTQVQYNNNGTLGAESTFTYDSATNTMSVPTVNTGVVRNDGNANVIIRNLAAVNDLNGNAVYLDSNNVFVGNTGNRARLNAASATDLQIVGAGGSGVPEITLVQRGGSGIFGNTGNIDVRSASTPSGGGFAAIGNINLAGNVNIGQYGTQVVAGTYGNLQVDGNIRSSTNISAVGNVTGGNVIGTYLWGDGSNITGVVGGSSSVRINIKNTSGSSIAKGTPVYATGTVGASTTIEVAASRADTDSTMPCIGLADSTLAINDQGYAISVGTLTGVNTAAFATGDLLYVAATGGLTKSRPTGTNIVQTVGVVGRVNATNGSIETNIWTEYGLPNLGNGNIWYGNAAAYPTETSLATVLSTYTGNLSAGNITSTGIVSATGNVRGGNINTDGIVSAGGNIVTGGNITATGNIRTSGFISATGDIIGQTLNIGGNGTIAGNANIGSSSADSHYINGSVDMLYNGPSGYALQTGGGTSVVIQGSITNGNIVFNKNSGNADNFQNINAWNANTSPQQARITIGTGYDGDFSNARDPLLALRGSQLLISTKQTIGNADVNQSARAGTGIFYADLGGATLTNINRRLQGFGAALQIGNGTQTISSGAVYATAAGGGGSISIGNIFLNGVGTFQNTTTSLSHGTAALNNVLIGGNATVGNSVATFSQTQFISNNTGNSRTAIGSYSNFTGGSSGQPTPGNVYGFYMSGTTNNHGVTNSNFWRIAPNYYFLRNEDDVAQNQMGSLRAYHEFNGVSGTTSGSLTIDKANGQVQQVNLTGNVSSLAFSNFVTSASDSVNTDEQCDTVTIIFNQGSTGGYGVTFPTGSQYKYAGNVTALQSTAANSVSLVSVSAVRISSTTTYLITISPGFV